MSIGIIFDVSISITLAVYIHILPPHQDNICTSKNISVFLLHENKKILFAIIVDNSRSIICQNGIKINCSHILPANKNFTFTIFDIFFLFPAIFDNLPPYSPRSTVPVLGAQTGTVAPNTVPVSGTQTCTVTTNTVPVSGTQTGTVNAPAAGTVPVTVPVIVPVLGTKTGTVDASNPLCHKASPSPNIDKDKDKYFHSVNSSQYDSIRTDSSSKNGSIHNSTDYRIF